MLIKQFLIGFCFTAFITVYFISCSSSEDEKYNLLTKADKKSIAEFCKCSEPFYPVLERAENVKDSAEAVQYIDSLTKMFKQLMPCLEKVKAIEKDASGDKEMQVLYYVKEKHPKCYKFLRGEEKTIKSK